MMNENTEVFVGYFRSTVSTGDLLRFVNETCKHATGVQVFSQTLATGGAVNYCRVSFPTASRATRARRALEDVPFEGHFLVTRFWVERTAANERRNVNWRKLPWDGAERRRTERRHYTHPARQAPGRGAISVSPDRASGDPGNQDKKPEPTTRLRIRSMLKGLGAV